ncbi:hypothetical protein FACS189483_09780 [Spirochaetia bacterium]|nr:hypothetical protein FACS189483_09780 [Spirochaetia bacterium]
MKIIFIGGRDIHALGGIETYMRNLASELVKLGHVPIVYCESDRNKEEWYNGFLVIHQKSYKSNLFCKPILGLKATIHSLINIKDADIYHYNAWPPSLWVWIPRMFGKTALMQGHGFEWRRTKYSIFQQKIIKFMEYLVIHINNHLLMVSQEQSDFFLLHYKRICTTIPTAVYLPSSLKIESDICKRFNLEINDYYLYLGRLVQEKNPDILIKAFKQSGIKNKKLVIAGSNDMMPEYVKTLKLLADNNDIVFTGAVYGIDKEALLLNCFVFCIPSTVEGLSITLFEAMSYHKPIIASDILSNREGLGNNGIWVKAEDVNDLSNKLIYCIDNSRIIESKGELNYHRVADNFTWDIVVKKYVSYVDSIRNKAKP